MAGRTLPFLLLGGAAAASVGLPVQLETRSAVNSRLANVHLSSARAVDGPITVAYGDCSSSTVQDTHHLVGKAEVDASNAKRLVWILPEETETGGCLSAWDSAGTLVGRSEPQLVHNIHKRNAEKRACKCEDSGLSNTGFQGLTLTLSHRDEWGQWHRHSRSLV